MSVRCKLKSDHNVVIPVELHQNGTKSRFTRRRSREVRRANCEIINTLRNYNVARCHHYGTRDLRLFLVKRSLVSLEAIRTNKVVPVSV